MERSKKIVVVMPAYNAEKTLERTLDDITREWWATSSSSTMRVGTAPSPSPGSLACASSPASGVPTAPRSGSLCSLAGQGDSAHRAMPSGLTIQTFGDRINLHMHLHFLVTECGRLP
jgi:hypothetical protein